MLIETYAPTHSMRLLADGKESLASSLGAASVQKSILEHVIGPFRARAHAITSNESMIRGLFPMHIDIAGFKKEAAQRTLVEEREQERLAARLRAAFDDNPLEDGMDHSAERIIGKTLQSIEGQPVLDWLSAFSLDAAYPSFGASVLRCLGRLPVEKTDQTHVGTGSWRAGLVRDALAMDDVEIRDAAVQAAELWGDQDLIDVLTSHNEPEPWLRDYIRDVIDDLGA